MEVTLKILVSTSKYFCRYCEESRENWLLAYKDDRRSDNSNENNSETRIIPVPSRTKESYDFCVDQLDTNPNGFRGIMSNSRFNEFNNFHVANTMPPCLAHDLFEGIVQYDLYLALIHFEKNYKLKKEIINRRVENFGFLGLEKLDKPSRIPLKGRTIGGHAVQNWVFLRFVPLIIGDKINTRDEVWKMILILIQIVGIVCSPSITDRLLIHLNNLIKTYLRLRVKCFKEPLRPKHHYLEHYPELTRVFGPLMGVNTLSFEHKHVFCKNFVRTSRNFKNVTQSISTKHQRYQSALTKK